MKSSQHVSSRHMTEPKISNIARYAQPEPTNRGQTPAFDNQTKFNLKITDLSVLENPFVVFQNVSVDHNGYLMIEDESQRCFPWMKSTSELARSTLKIEVTFCGMPLILRFIHVNKLYPVEYPKIALQIANNLV